MTILSELKRRAIPISKAFLTTLCGISFLLCIKHLVLNYEASLVSFLQYASYSISFLLAWILVYLIAFKFNSSDDSSKKNKEENVKTIRN